MEKLKQKLKKQNGNTTLNIIIFIVVIAILAILVTYYYQNANKINQVAKSEKETLNIAMYLSDEFQFDETYNQEEYKSIVMGVKQTGDTVYITFTNGHTLNYINKQLIYNGNVIVDDLYSFKAELSEEDRLEILNITYKKNETDNEIKIPFSYNHEIVETRTIEEEQTDSDETFDDSNATGVTLDSSGMQVFVTDQEN